MALSKSYTRVTTSTASKNFPMSASVAEHDGKFKVDLTTPVTQDDTDVVTKTFSRIVIDPVISGENVAINVTVYTFPGSAVDYTSGGNTPALSVATASTVLNMSAFQTAAGDATP